MPRSPVMLIFYVCRCSWIKSAVIPIDSMKIIKMSIMRTEPQNTACSAHAFFSWTSKFWSSGARTQNPLFLQIPQACSLKKTHSGHCRHGEILKYVNVILCSAFILLVFFSGEPRQALPNLSEAVQTPATVWIP